jgi:hypothetical protein
MNSLTKILIVVGAIVIVCGTILAIINRESIMERVLPRLHTT